MTERRYGWREVLAGALLALALALAATAVAAGVASGLGFAELLDGFAVSNTIIGLSLATAGFPIARHRPANPIGWLLLGGGVGYVLSGAGYALLAAATEPGADAPVWRAVALLTNAGWPWAITLCLPLVLLLFPDGRLLGPRWRWALLAPAVATAGFLGSAVFPPRTLAGELGVRAYLQSPDPGPSPWESPLPSLAAAAAYLLAFAALVIRYRRGDEARKRQLLWPVLGATAIAVVSTVDGVFGFQSWISIFVIAALPISIMIGILRHQLLDIRLVVSRTFAYLALTGLVVAGYLGLVAALDTLWRRQVGVGASLVATLVVAIAFNPVRLWMQRRVDRLFYGAGRDPVRAMAEVGARLGEVGGSTPAGLAGVLEALCHVLRLPSAAVSVDGREIAGYGVPPALRQSLPLRQGGEDVGELTVGLRPGESRLAPADERVLELLSTSLAVAVRAVALAGELGHAREELVNAREEERRRLRRDLHDGLGPALSAVVLKADAARRLATSDPQETVRLLASLRDGTTAAIESIRRLVNELRPAALDNLGLVAALREQASQLNRRVDGAPLAVTVDAESTLDGLPAAVEVAAYRIATEALTNVSRHSSAAAATVLLRVEDGVLTLVVDDDGADGSGPWRPGVGLTSIRERTAELGGACAVGPHGTGGRVSVTIPLGGAR